MKICTRCKIEKQLEEFHKNSTNKDGRKTICKSCSATYHQSRYNYKEETLEKMDKVIAAHKWVHQTYKNNSMVDEFGLVKLIDVYYDLGGNTKIDYLNKDLQLYIMWHYCLKQANLPNQHDEIFSKIKNKPRRKRGRPFRKPLICKKCNKVLEQLYNENYLCQPCYNNRGRDYQRKLVEKINNKYENN